MGIKFTNSTGRHDAYIDLDMHRKNELLREFLDGLDVKYAKGKEPVSLEEFNRHIDERLKNDTHTGGSNQN